MQWHLHQLLVPWQLASYGDDVVVDQLCCDSRLATPGCLFFAYTAPHCDRLEFIADAIAAGAVAVVVNQAVLDVNDFQCKYPNVTLVEVADLYACYGEIAARFYKNPTGSMSVVGVTGTNGKSSCAYYIAQALTLLGKPCAMATTFGIGMVDDYQPSALTTLDPIALQQAASTLQQQGVAALALEMSSHALEQNRLQGAHVDVAIFTNMTRDHLDYHPTMQHYAHAKEKIFALPGLKHVVINLDDPMGQQWAQRYAKEFTIMGVTKHEATVQRFASIIDVVQMQACEVSQHGVRCQLVVEGSAITLESALLGEFNLYNLAECAAALKGLGFEWKAIVKALGQVAAAPGRMQSFGGGERARVIVDYAHTPDALEQILTTLKAQCSGRLSVVFGCGGERDAGKRVPMGKIAATYVDQVVITNDNPRAEDPLVIAAAIAAGAEQALRPAVEVVMMLDRAKAINYVISRASTSDVVVIAGKGHEQTQVLANETIVFDDAWHVKQALAVPVEE